MTGECEASVVLWPDCEAIDLHCRLAEGHEGRHYDPEMGEMWEGDDADSVECVRSKSEAKRIAVQLDLDTGPEETE